MDLLPTLPFDLITEILSRSPVKLLLQFRCVCKSWNSLISDDPKFARKHLTNSTTHSLNSLGFPYVGILTMHPPNFFFNTAVTTNVNQLWHHSNNFLQKLHHRHRVTYGFGYDSVTDNYKVVVIEKTQVKVHTLGTKFWKNIGDFPKATDHEQKSGKYVSGTINWLAQRWPRSSPPFIVSFDLGNESYQEVLLPDNKEVNDNFFTLDVFADCLCVLCGHDVWLMKEYGNKESWTKLFTISYLKDPSMRYSWTKVVYVYEDGQLLLQIKRPFVRPQLIVYDPRMIGTFQFVPLEKSFNGSRFFLT
ncbi:hypothetical protein KIW84_056301 [Lathyrus oleraceus]|uniref:F-box domain-containing protein n=1 Tax=Pisum sativum TaxID=3888 RepID=A0A9D4WYY1_PEA|nr:hypothetical protein KIW84_056301 [Pisum sativum]